MGKVDEKVPHRGRLLPSVIKPAGSCGESLMQQDSTMLTIEDGGIECRVAMAFQPIVPILQEEATLTNLMIQPVSVGEAD